VRMSIQAEVIITPARYGYSWHVVLSEYVPEDEDRIGYSLSGGPAGWSRTKAGAIRTATKRAYRALRRLKAREEREAQASRFAVRGKADGGASDGS
jgi:hypothetical protein